MEIKRGLLHCFGRSFQEVLKSRKPFSLSLSLFSCWSLLSCGRFSLLRLRQEWAEGVVMEWHATSRQERGRSCPLFLWPAHAREEIQMRALKIDCTLPTKHKVWELWGLDNLSRGATKTGVYSVGEKGQYTWNSKNLYHQYQYFRDTHLSCFFLSCPAPASQMGAGEELPC